MTRDRRDRRQWSAEKSLWETLFEAGEDEFACLEARDVDVANRMVDNVPRHPNADLEALYQLAEDEIVAEKKAQAVVLVRDQDRVGRYRAQVKVGWQGAPDLKPHLDQFDVLRGLAAGNDGAVAILRWAQLSEPEMDVVMLDAAGFTVEAIGKMLDRRPRNVETLIDTGYGAIHAALLRWRAWAETQSA